jgi:hypothetical protein
VNHNPECCLRSLWRSCKHIGRPCNSLNEGPLRGLDPDLKQHTCYVFDMEIRIELTMGIELRARMLSKPESLKDSHILYHLY